MTIKIAGRYMLVPVSETAVKKKLLLKKGGKICVELDTRLSSEPDYVYPYDLRDYVGETMELEILPGCDFVPRFAEKKDDNGLYQEKGRPAAHFTTAMGWINDPNGFVFYEGRYHLFYQHNPVDREWGNMHWGHAVSCDLIHWTEEEEAVYPDELGTVFSGSAVVDEKNVSGLGKDGRAPLLLFYTAAGGTGLMSKKAEFTQRLIYSVDGGRTFVKYPETIIDHIAESNRDPKVIWCDELNAYVLALYLRGEEFALFKSDDLLHWTQIQRICLEKDDECPDFYPLMCEGERRWVLTAAHDHYLVGEIKGGVFVPEASAGWLHSGRSYAAQTCFIADNSRRIRFGWNQSTIHGTPFNGSMATPCDMFLKKIDGKICLCAAPCAEFEALRGEKCEAESKLALSGRANDIELSIPADGIKTISLMGLEMMLNTETMTLSCKSFSIPVRKENGVVSLRLIQDVHSVEVFACDKTMLVDHMSDYLMNRIECAGARIAAWPLKNIWTAES